MGATCYYHIGSRKAALAPVSSLREATDAARPGGYAWVDLEDPSHEELSALAEPLGLHPLAVEDCLDDDQVPKVEEFPGHTFILFNYYRGVRGQAAIEEVNFFLGARFLVTVHSHGRPGSGFGEHLRAVVEREAETARRGPDFLLQILLDHIVDEKFAAIEAVQEDLDQAEEDVLGGTMDFRPDQLMRLRRHLLLLRKSLVYEREILVRICRRDSPFVSEKAVFHFRDIYDHLAKFFEAIEICREVIASLIEIQLSMVNNHMAMVSNKTNHVMRRLTLITTIFMPLTLLAGVGGMSEWSMMTGPENWRVSYPLFLLFMAAIAVANYYLLRSIDARDRLDGPAGRVGGAGDDASLRTRKR